MDSAISAYAILLQLMYCSIASWVLHIAYCISHVACCVGVRSPCGDCFLAANWKTVTETHRELVQMYGENSINVSNKRRWKRDLENNRRFSLEDEWCSGWPSDSLTIDNICCVHEILKANDYFELDKVVAHMPPVECGW